jgi:ribosomal protein L10
MNLTTHVENLRRELAVAAEAGGEEARALAELPSRDVLLAHVAGGLAAPLQQLAGLLQALPRNLEYGLSALIEAKGGAPESPESTPEPTAEEA